MLGLRDFPKKGLDAYLSDSGNLALVHNGIIENFSVLRDQLKKISYIHAEGYPAAEMKHGPIAIIDADFPANVNFRITA